MAGPKFNLNFDPAHGEAQRLSPLIRRVTANNTGPFTFQGTNTYILGTRSVAVIDPGPDDGAHIEALGVALADIEVSHILVTHTHRDHSPAAARLQQMTGAPIYGEGPHRPARELFNCEINPLDAAGDTDFRPDELLADDDVVTGDGWTLRVVATPGHTANHLCFALQEENTLFSGDHVMGWSTTIVAPPDGSMADYMASLAILIDRDDGLLLPGHGGPIDQVSQFLSDLKNHRLGRERAVLDQLAVGENTIPAMVKIIYARVDSRLHGAAALSILAHLEDLVARGQVACDGAPSISARFALCSR
jgi:glyoxylase-like metal-dependent hydrolase (beta-lactamase superfamily II)